MFRQALFLAVSLAAARVAAAQTHHEKHHPRRAATDSAWAAMQERGRKAMGVDQYTSVHRFETLPDGGRIELQRPTADAADVETIRAHLRDIETLFSAGDFSIPGFVHDGAVPGTDVMAGRKDRIQYRFLPLPKGGQLRITTSDPDALAAIARFLEFQRTEHRTHH